MACRYQFVPRPLLNITASAAEACVTGVGRRRGHRRLADTRADAAATAGAPDSGRCIQRALNRVAAVGGGVVRLEGRAVYHVYGPLHVGPNVELRGANDGTTFQGRNFSFWLWIAPRAVPFFLG